VWRPRGRRAGLWAVSGSYQLSVARAAVYPCLSVSVCVRALPWLQELWRRRRESEYELTRSAVVHPNATSEIILHSAGRLAVY